MEGDLIRPQLLRDSGWQVALVLAKDWHADRDAVLRRLVKDVERPPPAQRRDAGN